MQKHFQFLACASSVTGAHDMGNLAEQIFLSLRMRVDPVDTEHVRISELAKTAFTKKEEPKSQLIVSRINVLKSADRRSKISSAGIIGKQSR